MADIISILSANYKAVGDVPIKTPYVPVDPALYRGHLERHLRQQQDRSRSRFRTSGLSRQGAVPERRHLKYQDVLIKDDSFRVGDTKFMLTADGGSGASQERRHRSSDGATFLDTAVAIQSR